MGRLPIGAQGAYAAAGATCLATAALVLLAAGNAPAPTSARALCANRETPIFACSTGRKMLAICGRTGGATYRYGLPNRVELESSKLAAAYRMYSGGGETQVSFTNKDYSYIVFDRAVRAEVNGEMAGTTFSSGLLVSKGGRVISRRLCREEATLPSQEVQRLLPTGEFLYHD